MTMTQEQRRQVMDLIQAGQKNDAVTLYHNTTGCGLAAASVAVEELMADSHTQPSGLLPGSAEESAGADAVRHGARGTTWTLVAAVLVFVAILGTVYFYLFPRLFGERVSPRALLEIRAASMTPKDAWAKMLLPDGSRCFVSDAKLMTAEDFSLFRGDGLQSPPRLTLYFSKSGIQRSMSFQAQVASGLAVLLPNKTVALTEVSDWQSDRVTFDIPGLSPADANEIFARLTD